MPESLPMGLLVAWTLYVVDVSQLTDNVQRLDPSRPRLRAVFQLSAILGMLGGVGILVVYAYWVAWYWAAILFLVSQVTSGIVEGLALRFCGEPTGSLVPIQCVVSSIFWPLIGLLCVYAIQQLHH